MKADVLFFTGRPSSGLMLLLLVLSGAPCLEAESREKPGEEALFTWNLLWTGSWYNSIKNDEDEFPLTEELFNGGTLYNRGDLSLGLKKPGPDAGVRRNRTSPLVLFRFLATDKRLLPPVENDSKAGFNPALGIYHPESGSRLLYGVQSEYGLPARINNIWIRSVPFMESRSPSSRDLKTEPAAKDTPESFLYLALPRKLLPPFNAFAFAALDEELSPALGTGFGFGKGGAELRLEGFYTQKELQARKVSAWFSSAPPLPERDFRIFALAAIFSSPKISFATDWAFSETFAWGQGAYGNFAFTLGKKPWRFSLAGDGAGSRFADRSGSTAGSGFRVAAKGERFWPRSGYLRFQGVFRSPGLEESFDRGALSLYFRPSAPSAAEKRNNPHLIRFSRSSLSISRDARKPEKTSDTLNSLAGFYIGPLSSVFSFTLNGISCIDENAGLQSLFCSPAFEVLDSIKVAGEFGIKFGIFDLKTKLGYTARAKKDPLWEPSINCSIKPGKWGRIGIKIASTDFPEKWNYTVSWRFAYSDKK